MKRIKICYPAVFHPETVGYSVSVPDMERINCGCYTSGDTFEEACEMAFDAIGLALEEVIEANGELPIPSKPENLAREDGDFIVPIVYDQIKYMEINKGKSVKKTLTIPEWLNDIATENGVNFSKLLQTALKQRLGIE